MWQIRVGLESDRDSVKNLWEAAGLGGGSEIEWRTLVGSPRAELLLAEQDGAVIGACVATFDGWRAFVYHMAVAPTHRRQGVATALLKAAESAIHGRGAQRVFALVNEAMTDGLALCTENGYETEGDLVLVKELDVVSDADKGRKAIAAFEDLTTPEQRKYGVYFIRSKTTDYSQSFTGPYRQARKLARSRTQYGDIELSFLEAFETPAAD